MVQTLFSSNNNYTQSYTLQPSSPIAGVMLPSFPALLTSSSGLRTSGAANIEFAGNNLRTPYTHQADFGVQQQLTNNTSVTLSYMWSRGIQFFSVRDVNQPVVTPTNVTYSILAAQMDPLLELSPRRFTSARTG